MLNRLASAFKSLLPGPFSIALLLTLVVVLASVFRKLQADSLADALLSTADSWQRGLFNPPMLVFTVQMMLMLVLGHALALSPPIERFLNHMAGITCRNSVAAAFWVSLLTIVVAWYNWGLGLVFGAIYARKCAEYAGSRGIAINYPLIGAAGYSGLMIWHGGLSGSSLAKAAEKGHLQSLFPEMASSLPESLDYSQTVFSPMNLSVSLVLLVSIPLFMALLAKRSATEIPEVGETTYLKVSREIPEGAERLDHSPVSGRIAGLLIMAVSAFALLRSANIVGAITPDWLNLGLFGLALFSHGRIHSFLSAVQDGIGGAAGILVQFPLYFGVMGIMKESGLLQSLADGFTHLSVISDEPGSSFPLLTWVSAAIINVFVPSGGGQWAIQGPLIIQGALETGAPLNKCILAMAYGDQLTNMLQPFWALPLLGITGLKARQIFPYSFLLMLLGALIFLLALAFF